jgi:hypothetical protein
MNLWSARPKWHAKDFHGTRHLLFPFFFIVVVIISFGQPASLYCEEYVNIYTCVTAYKLQYMNYHSYQITLQRTLTQTERWEVLTGYFTLGRRQGGEWENVWHWTQHFTMPAINSWPKCPNKNQMSIPFSTQRELLCFCYSNWTVSTGSFLLTLCLLFCEWTVNVSGQTPAKGTSRRSENFEVSDKYLLLLNELPHFLDSKTQFATLTGVLISP